MWIDQVKLSNQWGDQCHIRQPLWPLFELGHLKPSQPPSPAREDESVISDLSPGLCLELCSPFHITISSRFSAPQQDQTLLKGCKLLWMIFENKIELISLNVSYQELIFFSPCFTHLRVIWVMTGTNSKTWTYLILSPFPFKFVPERKACVGVHVSACVCTSVLIYI